MPFRSAILSLLFYTAGCATPAPVKVFAYPDCKAFSIVRLDDLRYTRGACRREDSPGACFDPKPRVIYIWKDAPWALTHELCHACHGDYEHTGACLAQDWWN